MSNKMLEVKDLRVNYGHIQAVKGLNFSVSKGEIISILGANGAGKTSTLHGIQGIVKSRGTIFFNDKDISGKSCEKKVKTGLILCPENRHIFSDLSVEDNMKMGLFSRGNRKNSFETVFQLFPRLKERKKQKAGSLSGGEQQMLAIGRAMMSEPELLMLDEPSLGLAPILVDDLFKVLLKLKEKGISILLVEQNANKALKISDRAYILQNGIIVHEGDSLKLMNDKKIKEAYLGI